MVRGWSGRHKSWINWTHNRPTGHWMCCFVSSMSSGPGPHYIKLYHISRISRIYSYIYSYIYIYSIYIVHIVRISITSSLGSSAHYNCTFWEAKWDPGWLIQTHKTTQNNHHLFLKALKDGTRSIRTSWGPSATGFWNMLDICWMMLDVWDCMVTAESQAPISPDGSGSSLSPWFSNLVSDSPGRN